MMAVWYWAGIRTYCRACIKHPARIKHDVQSTTLRALCL